MKKFAFVSDFDGTLTDKDFFQIVIDKFVGDKGRTMQKDWASGSIGVYEFLSNLFNMIGRPEEEILAAVREIPFDEHAAAFIRKVQKAGGDFIILSAGTDYYIKKILEQRAITGVTVIANPGVYHQGGIQMTADAKAPHYSPLYGIDKLKAFKTIQMSYAVTYYAGDGEPDLKAALHADTTFARRDLKELLELRGHKFIPFAQFQEIDHYLTQKGVIS